MTETVPNRAPETLTQPQPLRTWLVIQNAIGIFRENQRGFWRLATVPIVLIFFLDYLNLYWFFGATRGISISYVSAANTLFQFTIYAAILCPLLVHWHRLVLTGEPLPRSAFESLKYDKTVWVFFKFAVLFFSVFSVLPAFSVDFLSLSASNTLGTHIPFRGYLHKMAEICMVVGMCFVFGRLFLVFPELVVGQYQSLKTTWNRNTENALEIFWTVAILYLLCRTIFWALANLFTLVNVFLWDGLELSLSWIATIGVFLYSPLFIVAAISASVIGALAISVGFKNQTNVERRDDA